MRNNVLSVLKGKTSHNVNIILVISKLKRTAISKLEVTLVSFVKRELSS